MTWKDEIKKALNIDRSLRDESLDVIEDAILELAKRPECIKNAKAERNTLTLNIWLWKFLLMK